MTGTERRTTTNPAMYANLLLNICNLYPTPEQWAEKNAHELRAVLAALLADREQSGVVLTFTDGQVTGWNRTDNHGPHED